MSAAPGGSSGSAEAGDDSRKKGVVCQTVPLPEFARRGEGKGKKLVRFARAEGQVTEGSARLSPRAREEEGGGPLLLPVAGKRK